jgi:hypothetical protein
VPPAQSPAKVALARAAVLCGLLGLTAFPGSGWAGSARDYLSAPIDTWLTFYNFGYSTSVTPEDGMDVTSSIRSNVLSQSVVVTRTMDYWGRTGGISVVLPYRSLNASSDVFQASNQGISDVAFLWQMNIFGAPALTREQFRSYVPQPFASFHLFVATPLGKYEPAAPLNPSANRWTFFPTVNYSYTPDRGWTWLETYLSTKLFTANDDYRVGGASTLTQKPLFLVEGQRAAISPPRCGYRRTPITTLAARPASMAWNKATPPTPSGLGWAWARGSGPVVTWFSIMRGWSSSPLASPMLKRFE